jgi:hypothetical protein
MALRVQTCVVAMLSVLGCGERSDSDGGIVPAAAFERPDRKAAVEKFESAVKKADEKAAAAAAAAEADLQAHAEAVTIVPPTLPKSLKVACAEVAEALDAIVRRQFEDDPAGVAEWETQRTTMMAEARSECEDQGELDVAACKAHALRNADDRLVGDAFGLMERCQEKYADELAQKRTK